MKSLLEYPGSSREIDVDALDNYFTFGYVPAPLSIFQGISQLLPGHLLVWERIALGLTAIGGCDRPGGRLPPAKKQSMSCIACSRILCAFG